MAKSAASRAARIGVVVEPVGATPTSEDVYAVGGCAERVLWRIEWLLHVWDEDATRHDHEVASLFEAADILTELKSWPTTRLALAFRAASFGPPPGWVGHLSAVEAPAGLCAVLSAQALFVLGPDRADLARLLHVSEDVTAAEVAELYRRLRIPETYQRPGQPELTRAVFAELRSAVGRETARAAAACQSHQHPPEGLADDSLVSLAAVTSATAPERRRPRWDAATRTLFFGDREVKQYHRHPADTQTRILKAFEEAGWPPSVKFKFPSADHRRNAIRDLNKALSSLPLIRFFGDGTGEQVRWAEG